MEPPARPYTKRRAASAQSSPVGVPQKYTSNGSPSPFTSNTKLVQQSVETRRPKSSQTVSLGWEDGEDMTSRHTSRLQVELAGCIETKTVTTTTTTKRSYPPLLIQGSRALSSLDAKEYPLALKPTPPELTKFSYQIEGPRMGFEEEDEHVVSQENFPNERRNRNPYPRHETKESLEYSSEDLKRAEALQMQRLGKKREELSLRRSLKGLPEVLARSPINVGSKPRSSHTNGGVHVDLKDKGNEIYKGRRPENLGLGMHMMDDTSLPATPDMSEVEASVKEFARPFVPSFFTNNYTPQSGLSQNESFNELRSPDASNQESFNGAVATPPIAESDLEPAELPHLSFAQPQRPVLNTAAAQNASLPSPGLSPTFASTEMHNGMFDDSIVDDEDDTDSIIATLSADSQDTLDNDEVLRVPRTRAKRGYPQAGAFAPVEAYVPTVMDVGPIINSFDSMPDEMKALVMYQLSRRCPKKVLRMVANFVNPALMCDFLAELPTELSLQILSFLDYKDLCRAAQVSKQWRNVIDSNETGWKELFDRDGFVLSNGELERAIHQGWGWQDPHGPDGYEKDLSVPLALPAADSETTVVSSSKSDAVRKARSTTKRKRAINTLGSSERSKRRATGNEFTSKAQEILARYPHTARYHKSEGPLSAASAAAAAVPDPQLGLPGLQKLHLFKSLYRRHYMLRQNWTQRNVEPHHMAFKAHPAHVITCLQFDDDKILTGSDDTLIHVYDTKTGVLRKKLEGHEGGVWALQYEGNVLVSGSTDRSVRVWDIEKGLCTQVFHGHTSTVRCLQILMPTETGGRTAEGKPIMVPEKPLIITGSRDSQLRVWRLPEEGSKRYIQTGPPVNDADCPYFLRVLSGHSHSVRAIAAHQDTLVSGSYDHTVRVWKISTGETVHRLAGHGEKVYSVVLDHKRNRCISGSMDNSVKIWSLDTGVCLFTLEGHTSLVGLLDLRDERLVSAAADATLRIWDPDTGICKSTLSAHTGAITCFQHDGQKVISGSDRTLKMWNVKTGDCIKDLLTDLTGVWQVKFNDRRCVAAVQRDNLTFVEVLDFGASRDGVPASERGRRILLPAKEETDRITAAEVEDTDATAAA